MTKPNRLYYGDNLTIMRDCLPSASVDLIYLDPPFNSQRNYNLIYTKLTGYPVPEQEEAFCDAWRMDPEKEEMAREMPITLAQYGVTDDVVQFWTAWIRPSTPYSSASGTGNDASNRPGAALYSTSLANSARSEPYAFRAPRAFLAMATRFRRDSFAARALPPLAARSWTGVGAGSSCRSPVAISPMNLASCIMSRGRFGGFGMSPR